MSQPSSPLLSIVVPVFNEETNIRPFYDACSTALSGADFRHEIIFVDDGSHDQTYPLVQALSGLDSRVRGLKFARNFGSHAAILAGFRAAKGDAAVMISVDLQDPPDLLPELVKQWRAGHEVVWAVREGRDDPWSKKVFANVFYWVLRKTALPNYPAQGMDFGLFDRKVLTALGEIKEANQFIVGLILWLGFRQTTIPYRRRARNSGVSKWPFWKRLKAAIDAIVSFSYFPIRLIAWLGLGIAGLSFLYALFVIVNRVVFGAAVAGYPSVMVAILFLGGVQLITLGILGEYIWRGTDQVKGRPQYIVMDKTGFDP